MFDQLPSRIWDFSKKQKVGHLSVRTKRGVIEKKAMVFGTPRTAKKLDLLKKNPRVSFTVDNGELMKNAIGITVLGRTETYGFDDLKKGLKLGLRSMAGFMKKYPELMKFYVMDMDQLPDANKFYKYVFVRINPTRIVHWDGYEFGRITTKRKKGKKKAAEEEESIRPEDDPVIYAKYVQDYYKDLDNLDGDFDEDFNVERLADDLYSNEVYINDLQEVTMDVASLLSLPDNLRKTGLAMAKLEEASMDDVAAEIGSSRREAKNYLDRLTLMKMLNKKRKEDQLIYYTR
jgi:hypothetical protein